MKLYTLAFQYTVIWITVTNIVNNKNLRSKIISRSDMIEDSDKINFMKFNSLIPEIYVSNFQKSLEFYSNLGFKIEYHRDNPEFAFLSFQGSQIMIQELQPDEKEEEKLGYPFGRGINFQIETNNLQIIIDSLKKNNYPLKRGIKDSWYRENNILHGCREILVSDPDGYLLRFSQTLGQKPAKV